MVDGRMLQRSAAEQQQQMAGMAQPQPQQRSGGASGLTSADSRGKDCSSEQVGQVDGSGSLRDEEETEQVPLVSSRSIALLAGYGRLVCLAPTAHRTIARGAGEQSQVAPQTTATIFELLISVGVT